MNTPETQSCSGVSVRLANALANAEQHFRSPRVLLRRGRPLIGQIVRDPQYLGTVRNFGSGCMKELCGYIEKNGTVRQKTTWRARCAKWEQLMFPYTPMDYQYRKVLLAYLRNTQDQTRPTTGSNP